MRYPKAVAISVVSSSDMARRMLLVASASGSKNSAAFSSEIPALARVGNDDGSLVATVGGVNASANENTRHRINRSDMEMDDKEVGRVFE
mmetsp:Transcript_1195/g.3415  ORF Transcript_1195/g.3415 Transcript_1195/m.3415 type:complete len:90 (-) Transcript_1195:66-335(-)